MQAVLVGLGAVGGRAARQLLSAHGLTRLTVLSRHPDRAVPTAALLGQPAVVGLQRLTQANFHAALAGADAVLLASPAPVALAACEFWSILRLEPPVAAYAVGPAMKAASTNA